MLHATFMFFKTYENGKTDSGCEMDHCLWCQNSGEILRKYRKKGQAAQEKGASAWLSLVVKLANFTTRQFLDKLFIFRTFHMANIYKNAQKIEGSFSSDFSTETMTRNMQITVSRTPNLGVPYPGWEAPPPFPPFFGPKWGTTARYILGQIWTKKGQWFTQRALEYSEVY